MKFSARPLSSPLPGSRLAWAALVLGLFSFVAWADEVMIEPVADATLYEVTPWANGAGSHIFAGEAITSGDRRAVIRFDLTSIPSGSQIESVELTLNMSRTIGDTRTVTMHRVLTDWNEGPSDPPGEEGIGVDAVAGDATWLHTNYDTDLWSTPGGDFVPAPSASLDVGAVGIYTWGSTAELESDVSGWVGAPSSNFGWILIGDEFGADTPTAKRFDSREHPDPNRRPALRVVFTPIDTPTAIPTLDPRALVVLALLLALSGAGLVASRA